MIQIKNDLKKEAILELVKNDKKISKYIMGKKIMKEIYIPNKIINFVV